MTMLVVGGDGEDEKTYDSCFSCSFFVREWVDGLSAVIAVSFERRNAIPAQWSKRAGICRMQK